MAARRYTELDEQQSTYRDFASYLASDKFEPEQRRNHGMKPLNFDKVKPPGLDDKLEIPLENVTAINDTADFCRRLEAFRAGTKVRTTQGAATGAIRYTLYVPWKNPNRKQIEPDAGYSDGEDDEDVVVSPNPMRLLLWNIVGLGLLATAWKTTSLAEWMALAQQFGLK